MNTQTPITLIIIITIITSLLLSYTPVAPAGHPSSLDIDRLATVVDRAGSILIAVLFAWIWIEI